MTFLSIFRSLVVATAALASIPAAATEPAGAMRPTILAPIAHHDATLLVIGPKGEARYTPAQLEALGAYRLTTRTPWRDVAAAFDGVRLRDVLAASGLADARAIRVEAENDYSVVIPRAVWVEHDPLIATRVDGRAHTRREHGPLEFVFPLDADPTLGAKAFEQNWVWMAARIEAAE